MGWEDFSKNCQFVVGLGNRVRFWQDGWYGDQPFQLAFPRLYAIVIDKEVSVEESLSRQGAEDRRSWNVRFIRELNDWEMDEGLHFLHILGNNTPPMAMGDRLRWKLKPNGDFDVRSYYNKLRDSPSIVFPWKAIWKVKAPRRVSFFVWCVAWNKILTGDNLRLRKLVFVDWCIMCRHCGETVDHLLLHCEMTYRLWSFVFITFGLPWVIPRSITELLFGWWNWLGKQSSQIWNLVPLCILWCIWKERNRRTFEDLDSSGDQLLASFSGTLFDWSRAWGLTTSDSLPSFLSSLALYLELNGCFNPTKLAGFKLEVKNTTSAGHARKLASTVDISTCPDGIICVGGDGIINEVLNGLLSRDNQKEGISIPIGIIPAGSDNSLVWTVLGVRDPVSAAMAIVKGGLTATDVFAVEWIQTGVIHFGMTVSYFGFVSDVLELSEKYQKRFGPLRYLVAGFLKFLCLPKYNYEVEYLPASKEDREVVDMSELYTDIMRRSSKDSIPRASSLSSIDSIMTPSRMSGGDLDTTCSSTHASTEPSDYVRGLDPKAKRLSSGRSNVTAEPEVIHPQPPLSTTPNWPRTRSKSRTDKGWTGTNDASRCSWANATTNDKEDISSTLSDPGPIWDTEPKWDSEPNWDVENPIELPGPSDDVETGMKREVTPRFEEKWVATKGQFLGILVCNHACRTVQNSQVVAPKSEHDDNTMDMLLVHGSGRLRLLRFFVLLQMGRHLSLPYVEYVKVKSVKIKPGKHTHNGCGIDGELFRLNGQVISSLLPEQCRLIGRSASHV
ncbi:sphingoid long-chain bases kinase 1 [Quercus suber]|uniref:sphingoid long-chain bases kinase 1 n=1 Tax=Quercus suber TaxID=58331 RepID=UPI0032E02BF9